MERERERAASGKKADVESPRVQSTSHVTVNRPAWAVLDLLDTLK